VERFTCLPITVGVYCLWLGAQTADTDCDWLKQPKRFTAIFALVFGKNKTVLFCFVSVVRTAFRAESAVKPQSANRSMKPT